jgi:hypothetical protein
MTKTGTCDGCSSGAEADVYLRDGRLLELCDRHTRWHQAALRRQGALVIGHLLLVPLPSAAPYEGVAFEREFSRLALSATDRLPRRQTASAFLPSSERDRVGAVVSIWARARTRLSGLASRHRPWAAAHRHR